MISSSRLEISSISDNTLFNWIELNLILYVSIQNKEFQHGIFSYVSYPTLLEVALPMITIVCVCVCGYYILFFACKYVCAPYVCSTHRGQKGA